MVVAKLHRRINIFGAGHALLEHAHGFESQGDTQPAGSKARNIANHNRLFAQPATNFSNSFHCIIPGRFSDHNFNQPHQVNRIEKVHADDILRSLGGFGNFGYRKRRSVGGENERLAGMRFNFAKNFLFEFELLGSRFNDQVGSSQFLQVWWCREYVAGLNRGRLR